MATAAPTYSEDVYDLAGSKVQVIKGGSGDPLVIFHDELGHPGWLKYHQELAKNHTVYTPLNPGCGDSDPQEWIRNIRDLATFQHQALDDLGLGKVNAIGFSFGGWLAAQMASMDPGRFNKLALVGPMGILPPTGEIYDMFMVVAKVFITDGILNPDQTPEFDVICPEEPSPEQNELWDMARETSCRIGWKPYMYDHSTSNLLMRLKTVPTLLVWGDQDRIVPISAGQVFHNSIPGSTLKVIENCGHRPEVEKPDEFLSAVQGFLAS